VAGVKRRRFTPWMLWVGGVTFLAGDLHAPLPGHDRAEPL